MAIITISGRRVKRSVKNALPATSRGRTIKGFSIWSRQAKALAPWAGPGYLLTELGEAAMREAEAENSFERRQSAYRALGMHALADVQEIKRRYFVSDGQGEAGQSYVTFDAGTSFEGGGHLEFDDSVTVVTTSDADSPFACVYRGPDVSLPAESFELAAQLWLAIQDEAGVREGEVAHA